MDELYPEYVTKEAIEGLIKKLNLPKPDMYSQDWEYEVTDSSRVAEFMDFYGNNTLNKEEKFALMKIIISSYDEALTEEMANEKIASQIKSYLILDVYIHRNTISYWALLDEVDIEDCFAITPLMREVHAAL